MNLLTILIILLFIISIAFIILFNKYKKIKKVLKSLNTPLRQGYYKMSCTQGKNNYTGIINVYEIDRFTNGDSKIKINNIEITKMDNNSINIESAIEFLKGDFCSIKKTNNIIWLESENSIKESRKNKLNEIFKK